MNGKNGANTAQTAVAAPHAAVAKPAKPLAPTAFAAALAKLAPPCISSAIVNAVVCTAVNIASSFKKPNMLFKAATPATAPRKTPPIVPTILIKPPNGDFIRYSSVSPRPDNIWSAACIAGITTGRIMLPIILSSLPFAMSTCSCKPAQLFLYSSFAVLPSFILAAIPNAAAL